MWQRTTANLEHIMQVIKCIGYTTCLLLCSSTGCLLMLGRRLTWVHVRVCLPTDLVSKWPRHHSVPLSSPTAPAANCQRRTPQSVRPPPVPSSPGLQWVACYHSPPPLGFLCIAWSMCSQISVSIHVYHTHTHTSLHAEWALLTRLHPWAGNLHHMSELRQSSLQWHCQWLRRVMRETIGLVVPAVPWGIELLVGKHPQVSHVLGRRMGRRDTRGNQWWVYLQTLSLSQVMTEELDALLSHDSWV